MIVDNNYFSTVCVSIVSYSFLVLDLILFNEVLWTEQKVPLSINGCASLSVLKSSCEYLLLQNKRLISSLSYHELCLMMMMMMMIPAEKSTAMNVCDQDMQLPEKRYRLN